MRGIIRDERREEKETYRRERGGEDLKNRGGGGKDEKEEGKKRYRGIKELSKSEDYGILRRRREENPHGTIF